MWLKLLFAVVSLLVSIDSPTPNPPDQPVDTPSIPQDDSSHPQPDQPTQPNQPNNPTDIPQPDDMPSILPEDMLNLHIMVASHTDAGWIHTFEEYYQGTNSMDGGCVKCILDNLLNTLPGHEGRKYDMSEISFFKRWWIDQPEDKRNKFKTMLQNKQFEFINGGWAANDEATAYYEGIMENFILGHRWLQDTLDVDTLIGWQVDSFGNSATHAGLMAQAGYEGLFFSRADYVDRDTRRAEKSLQFNWAPPNPHNESVFTQMMYVTYSDTKFMIPDNFNCRSVFCRGNLNAGQYQQVADYVKKQSSAFRTKNILFMVCDDFLLWQGADKDYVGAEAMVQYYKDNPKFGINAKISHLSEYLKQVQEDLISMGQVGHIPEKHDDTFPYVEKPGHVWTGYFTSKPMFKLMVREYGEYYNAMKLLVAKMMLADDWSATQHSTVNQNLIGLEEPLAIVQHHDAVSGTMKETVRFDYEDMLNKGRNDLEATISPLIVNYLKGKINEELTAYPFKYDWFYRDNSYNSAFTDDSTTTFSVFNPGQTRKLLIKVKIPTADYAIRDETNNFVDADIICHSEDTNNDCFVYFADEFPAYTTKVYKLNKSPSVQKLAPTQIDNQEQDLSTGGLTFKVKGDLKNFEYNYCQNGNCAGDSFSLDYKYYQSAKIGSDSPSGAYVFTPVPQERKDYSTLKSGRVFKGKHISIVQIFRDNLRTDISVHSHQPERGIEITTFLEPLNVQPSGKEVVLLVSSSINNGNTEFYTDANGYFMQKRIKNHKDNFVLDTQNSINVNYYPVTSNMYIEDESSGKRLSIVTDRAQGASSLNPGEIEVMIHRVSTNDDWKGVGELLQEKERGTWNMIRVTTRHFLSFSNSNSGIIDQRRNQQYDLDRSAQLRFYSSKNAEFAGTANAEPQSQQVVPDLVKLYVRSYAPNEYIVRLHNLDEVNSKQVQLYDLETNMSSLLQQLAGKSVKVKAIEELSWMTTREKSDVLKNVLDPNEPDVTHQDERGFSTISLLPMEIRTFSIEV